MHVLPARVLAYSRTRFAAEGDELTLSGFIFVAVSHKNEEEHVHMLPVLCQWKGYTLVADVLASRCSHIAGPVLRPVGADDIAICATDFGTFLGGEDILDIAARIITPLNPYNLRAHKAEPITRRCSLLWHDIDEHQVGQESRASNLSWASMFLRSTRQSGAKGFRSEGLIFQSQFVNALSRCGPETRNG